jgi:hypothetical protein
MAYQIPKCNQKPQKDTGINMEILFKTETPYRIFWPLKSGPQYEIHL